MRMSDNLCVRCDRPTPDGYACSSCAYRAGDQLHELADMAPAARDVAHGLSRRAGGSGGSGKPGSRLPFDLGATSKLDAVQNRLSTWVGEVAHGRSRPIPAPRHLDDDPIVLWARWLAGHVEWIRHTDDADRFLTEVDECLRAVRSIARGPSEQKYLGPCGAVVQFETCPESTKGMCLSMLEGFARCDEGECVHAPDQLCTGDVYASRGSRTGRCRVCGAEVSTDERAAWLDGEVRSRAFRASEIEDAFGVNANLIRQWATPARGLIQVHGQDRNGRALYLLSQVLDIAAGQAAKRAEAQAKRARREATRAEGDAA
jgi:hypothetical protein